MKLSEELLWRGFANQTTLATPEDLDKKPLTFYWGVDPSAPSMTIGNLAAAMMARHFIEHGHKAVLLIGGATGLIGDPDGKVSERDLQSQDQIEKNKISIIEQYKIIFAGQEFEVVDNYVWFKDKKYVDFLREIGKHVPMRQMLNRDFVKTRLGEGSTGISYAEFSYVLMQAYDFLHLNREKGVTLQLCGSDQWGNSIAGVDLIRRIDGKQAHVWSAPLIVNKATGKKFGKSEDGAIWLDGELTPPNDFYQFWVNVEDDAVEDYLKIFTPLSKNEVSEIIKNHNSNPSNRVAQKRLAFEVTRLVHGDKSATSAQNLAASYSESLEDRLNQEPDLSVSVGDKISDSLLKANLVSSNSEARRLIEAGGVYINDKKINRDTFDLSDSIDGKLELRRGKKLKDSIILKLT
jgi:tyrosyl-tRNA synthetase